MFIFTAKYLTTAAGEVTAAPGVTNLNGFPVMSLEEFVKEGSLHTAAEDEDKPKKDKKDKKPEKKKQPEDKKPGNHQKAPAVPEAENKSEVDEDFGFGARTRPVGDEEMQEFADRSKKLTRTPHDRYHMPILHGDNLVKIVGDDGEEYDLAALKIQIMKRPESLLTKNDKMKHSGGSFYNIGLPALKGLVVNEKTGQFVVVDTCPGAGSCQVGCYAMKGNYIRVAPTSLKLSRILNFLINNPKKFQMVLESEIAVALAKADEGEKIVVRWHDAGDFFSPQYMKLAWDIARKFPDVDFYAYTKVGDVVNSTSKPSNFVLNFSMGAKPAEVKKVNKETTKLSETIPQKRFWDLIVTKGAHPVKGTNGQVEFKSPEAWDEFKDRLVEDYGIPKESIISYNEYMQKKKEGTLGKTLYYWNVVIPPGAGDNAAGEQDYLVHGSLLMWH